MQEHLDNVKAQFNVGTVAKSDVLASQVQLANAQQDFIKPHKPTYKEQRQIDKIIREALEERYSFEFIYVILRMIVHNEKERIDFLGLEKLIKDKLG